MKIIEWHIEDAIPEYDKRINTRGKLKKRYKKWMERNIAKLKIEGSRPITAVKICKLTLSYVPRIDRMNSDRATTVHTMLKEAGIVEGIGWYNMPDTRQIGRYSQHFPGVKIKLNVDETDERNKGINWKAFPVKASF